MPTLIPKQFYFRFEFPCRHVGKISSVGKTPLDLPKDCRLPFPGGMDRLAEFADVRIAWNEQGLAVSWTVPGKKETLHGEENRATGCDGLSLWLDTRDARSIHRASRYCQRFVFMAHDGGAKPAPGVIRKPIHRAQEDAPAVDLSKISFALFSINEDGDAALAANPTRVKSYRMDVFLPAETLIGFDPETNSRLGFCYRVRDREKGDQFLAAGPEFPYWEDPSLWSVLALRRKK